MRKRKIRWGRVFITATVVVGITAGAYQYITAPPTRLIEYQAEVKPGDTLWTICARIATNKDDMGKLVRKPAVGNDCHCKSEGGKKWMTDHSA